MSSTFGGLNILSRSLYANQASLDTVGHNIANAGTDGYSRQSVNLATAVPAGEVYGRNKNFAGSGVTVASITRARDIFTDRQLWKQTSNLGYTETSSAALTKLENIFSEPSDTGIQTVLNQFWSSWQALSTDASDTSVRAEVAQNGLAVVDAIKNAAQQLKDSAENVNFEVKAGVNTINQLTEGISKLNEQIYFAEFSGTNHANDLRDSRDLLVDQLSKMVNISVNEDSTGRYTINSNGVNLVFANCYTKLATSTTPSTGDVYGYAETNVIVADTGKAISFADGQMKALIDSRDSETKGIKGYMDSLESISKYLMQDFNAVHQSGYGTDNINGRNFFGDNSFDYASQGEPYDWLGNLEINSAINDTGIGLGIIAAKTSLNGISVSLPITNTGSGVPEVSVATGTYSGTPTNVKIKVDTVDSTTGLVSQISYSTDDGVNWSSGVALTGSKANLTIDGLSFELDTTALTSPAVDNSYSFTLSGSSLVSAPVLVDSSKNVGSGVPEVTTTGTYTGGTAATNVRIKVSSLDGSGKVNGIVYSTDDGENWSSAISGPPFAFNIMGLDVEINTDPQLVSPAIDNLYRFSLPAGNNANGDNAIKLGNSLKTDTSSATLGNKSLDEYYSSLIGTLGIQSQDAERINTNQQTVVDQLTNLRQSTSGVNMDEEMTDMIRFQKGYNAAARVLTAMDEMLDKLINGTGAVGR
ncbi:flagellar hook-associated protein FlgK [Desulfosporosinus orientis DSM 765]|uniref:Flagellar hook-associated protein 1 n=1 Tax=Desulfosporosinus orientis (strain ATCC 19365 / DSM 765 / NCIMB 8382 / VKM B-1628 / Singapore I) TaxID=768706 RepID=G7WI19_DESOD|nr:flagellar hook-associated protein FlgK [Desulfosporosinus orientis]AET70316.1 flagellar hook-associated protein FlgK [Desulfosporosinus orientis DSM 765]